MPWNTHLVYTAYFWWWFGGWFSLFYHVLPYFTTFFSESAHCLNLLADSDPKCFRPLAQFHPTWGWAQMTSPHPTSATSKHHGFWKTLVVTTSRCSLERIWRIASFLESTILVDVHPLGHIGIANSIPIGCNQQTRRNAYSAMRRNNNINRTWDQGTHRNLAARWYHSICTKPVSKRRGSYWAPTSPKRWDILGK